MTWRTPVLLLAVTAIVGGVAYSRQRVLGDQMELLTPLAIEDDLPSPTPPPIASQLGGQATPTAIPTPRPTRKPTPPPTAKQSGGQAKPQPKFTQEEIYNFTEKYGILYAVDPNVIRHMIICEAGLNPSAKNHIYAGLFQFDTRTWTVYRQKMGLSADPDLRYHAEEAIRTGAYMLSLGLSKLWPNCYPK